MNKGHLVLDNSVLSAFASGDWFHELSFWDPDYVLVTTELIWSAEFSPHHEYEKPDWIALEQVDTDQLDSRPVELGEPDWTLIQLAEEVTDSILVSNDRRQIAEAEHRNMEQMWGTKFLIQTFEACGIDEESFTGGVPAYTADVPLPDSVVGELQSAEKP